MNPIVQLIIAEIPSVIDLLKKRRAATDPHAPAVTSEEIIAAFEQLFAASSAKDQLLIAALRAEIAGAAPAHATE